MTVVIKELIIQGKVNESSKETEEDIIKIIDSKLSTASSENTLKETEKRQLVEECVHAVLRELESKLNY
ncbi:MAG: hypothetical protein ACJA1B_000975 [Polaribacter sp.]|jgi:hypothetical protein